MSFPEKVKSTLLGIVKSMALNPAPIVHNPEKDFTRNRKLGFAQILRLLLSWRVDAWGTSF